MQCKINNFEAACYEVGAQYRGGHTAWSGLESQPQKLLAYHSADGMLVGCAYMIFDLGLMDRLWELHATTLE